MMGAYENAMHEEGSVEDFHREIQRIIRDMRDEKNRAALYDIFFACRKIEVEHRRGKILLDGPPKESRPRMTWEE